MFDNLTSGFRDVRERLQGKRALDSNVIDATLKDIRIALLDADVELSVVRGFIEAVRAKAAGTVVQTRVEHKGDKHKISAADQFIKFCHEELVALMGGEAERELEFGKDGIARIMVVGLQGSGKTTTVGKVARLLQEKGHRPLLVAADIYRPAAVQQLKVLGSRLDVPVYHRPDTAPPDLCEQGVREAKTRGCDVVLFDTAGRLTIDNTLMQELSDIRNRTTPENIFLVIDAMIGQDSVRTARSFHEQVALDGVVLTKLDGDARGGAALSVRAVTGCPIVYVGMGEGLEQLEVFRPEGMADRILGFGDIVGLVQDFERVVDAEKAEADAERMLKGDFTFSDFLEQLRTLKKMGSMKDVFEKLPFFNEALPKDANVGDGELVRIEAMIQSMTQHERQQPELLMDDSRCRRIARGSGRETHEVRDLYGRFRMMKDMMGAIGKQPGLLGKLPGFKQMKQLGAMKNMDMSGLFDDMGDMGNIPRPKKAPVAAQLGSRDDARKARKAAKKRSKSKKRRR